MAIENEVIAGQLMTELNLDDAEKDTLVDLVTDASAVVGDSAGNLADDNPVATRAIKTLATQLYYDRTLENGMSKGLIMMLTHLQATPKASDDSGD